MALAPRSLWLPLLLITLSTPLPALGQREPTFLLIEEQAETEDELSAALKATVESVGESGQLVLTEINPISNEGALLFLLSRQPGAEQAPAWSRATQIDPRASKVTLLIEAKARTGSPIGMPAMLDINLRELYELRERPAKQRNTLLGAMLRNRWTKALSGKADDVDAITAHITPMLQMHAGGVAFQQPWFTGKFGGLETTRSLLTQPFDEEAVDDLLGRTRRPEERIKAASEGKTLPPLRSISERLDRKLEAALVKAREQHAADDAVWKHLNNLRSGPPRRLNDTDTAFFAYLDGGPPAKQAEPNMDEMEQRQGLKAGLDGLQ